MQLYIQFFLFASIKEKNMLFFVQQLSVNLKRERHEFVSENGGITYIDKKEN
jgi:hypothetical protein